ncbi:MAG: hypothetical protein ACRCVT_12445 [Leadbetterella sp.]
MYCDINFPTFLSEESLDSYLERGWFRMGQSLFTTSFLNFKNATLNTAWIRYDLSQFQDTPANLKIRSKNAKFSVKILPFEINKETEVLFRKYRESLPFSIAHSLYTLLFDESSNSIFNTYSVNVYDGKKLIALGIFDLGKNSSEGIINIYDPEYRKYSLGKYTILKKIDCLLENKFKYFYPGYIVPGNPHFDYKKTLSSQGIEYFFMPNNLWYPLEELDLSLMAVEKIQYNLERISEHEKLKHHGLKVMKYKFYDIKLYKEYAMHNLLTDPFFIHLGPHKNFQERAIMYDCFSGLYGIYNLLHVFEVGTNPEPQTYTKHFLRIQETIFQSFELQNIVDYLILHKNDFYALQNYTDRHDSSSSYTFSKN